MGIQHIELTHLKSDHGDYQYINKEQTEKVRYEAKKWVQKIKVGSDAKLSKRL